jgi:hypothetical protein
MRHGDYAYTNNENKNAPKRHASTWTDAAEAMRCTGEEGEHQSQQKWCSVGHVTTKRDERA